MFSQTENGCIDLVYSPDDGGWYAQEFDFKRKDNNTRTSRCIYSDQNKLITALRANKHRWERWC